MHLPSPTMVFSLIMTIVKRGQPLYCADVDLQVKTPSIKKRETQFFRYLKAYQNINIISALLAGIDIGMLTFSEYHSPPFSSLLRASQAFLLSSASCATILLIIATMLSFRFPDDVNAEDPAENQIIRGWDLMHASIPPLLLEWSLLSFLVGLLLWYSQLEGKSWLGFWLITVQVVLLSIYYVFTRWKMAARWFCFPLED